MRFIVLAGVPGTLMALLRGDFGMRSDSRSLPELLMYPKPTSPGWED